jgi:ParB family chromosome partitioning protein
MATTTAAKKGLGKGLSALMGDAPRPAKTAIAPNRPVEDPASAITSANHAGDLVMMPIEFLRPGKYQPRQHFDEESLSELADSLEKHGVMQPLVVRKINGDRTTDYEIIAGERRYRAAKLAKLKKLPVVVRQTSDADTLELALIENIQREDLNPLEEAAGYERLMGEFKHTQESLSKIVGKSRSHIANLLRLLKLPDSIKKRIHAGELTAGHARALLQAKNPEALAKRILEEGLSVRQAETLASGKELAPLAASIAAPQETEATSASRGAGRARGPSKTDDVLQLENMLSDSLGLKVSIDTRGGQAGDVVITYESLTQLDEILRRLGGGI